MTNIKSDPQQAFNEALAITLSYMDAQALLEYWTSTETSARLSRDIRLRIEYELQCRMNADGATSIPHETLSCEIKTPSPTYDISRLAGLRELLPENILETGFTPAHEETVSVPDRWDARQLKSWAKYGEPVRELIEAATIRGTPRLIIRHKEPPAGMSASTGTRDNL